MKKLSLYLLLIILSSQIFCSDQSGKPCDTCNSSLETQEDISTFEVTTCHDSETTIGEVIDIAEDIVEDVIEVVEEEIEDAFDDIIEIDSINFGETDAAPSKINLLMAKIGSKVFLKYIIVKAYLAQKLLAIKNSLFLAKYNKQLKRKKNE
ncbi:MAG: hypothetical protein UR26_C0001G0141 [candidate division TM6 bacterium GW2011_GWF2_32_72]|nr:MAG: hypothetical protein UR26_C0001G0141 [candidate division TM6 bacterium GW2011_GWF2_32_72]